MRPPATRLVRASAHRSRPGPRAAIRAWFSHALVAVGFAALGYLGGRDSPRADFPASLPAEPSPPPAESGSRRDEGRADSFSTPAEELRQLANLPPGRLRDSAVADALRRLAVRDPASAVRWLDREPNLVRRRALRAALLQGWTQTDPDGAIGWAAGLPASERQGAINDVLVAAAAVPSVAIRVASWACERIPHSSGDIGHALTTALAATGAFESAVEFAEMRPELRTELLAHAYYEWAVQDAAAAWSRMAGLTDPLMREEAYRGVLHGWSTANPAAVADYALQLDPGHRRLALEESLPRWVTHDPVGAAAWLNVHGGGTELDPGRVALATSPQLLSERPHESLRWALDISHPEMRLDTARAVLREWAARDATAARGFAETVPAWIPPNGRRCWPPSSKRPTPRCPTAPRISNPAAAPRACPAYWTNQD